MKIVAYSALHYGLDFLSYAIRSVIDAVDEYHVLYSSQGSHGHRTMHHCPDSRHALYRMALSAAGEKLRWHDGDWSFEGQQRDSIYRHCPDADAILVLDSDEIWAPAAADLALGMAFGGEASEYRIPIIHYWRSFHRAVLRDPAYPIRLILPRRNPTIPTTLHVPPINHMGYAQRSSIVEYKLLTHGHHDEFRKDCDWFKDRYLANAQSDCHPIGSEYWTPEPIDPMEYMPPFMKEHPYFNLEVIP